MPITKKVVYVDDAGKEHVDYKVAVEANRVHRIKAQREATAQRHRGALYKILEKLNPNTQANSNIVLALISESKSEAVKEFRNQLNKVLDWQRHLK